MDHPAVLAALLAHPAVEDCALLEREGAHGLPEMVAYVVSSGPIASGRLLAHLRATGIESGLPSAFVPVASIPLTPEGEVDVDALHSVLVIDEATHAAWERQVGSHPGVAEAIVLVEEVPERSTPLHLTDLLPDSLERLPGEEGTRAVDPGARSKTDREALATGPSLSHGEGSVATLAGALRRAAQRPDGVGVTYIGHDGSLDFQSYATLLADAERVQAGLAGHGVRSGDLVLFQLERQRDFLTAFWGCILSGVVPVPVACAPGYADANPATDAMYHAWELLHHPLVLTGRELAPALDGFAVRRGLSGFQVAAIEALLEPGPLAARHECVPADLALLMLTSGSTGAPKGVMLSHSNLVSVCTGIIQHNGLGASDVTFNWMPLEHVGGILMCHARSVFLGSRQIHCPTARILADPLEWLEVMSRHRCTFTWAPNFAYALVNDRADEIGRRRWDLSAARMFVNGGEAVVARTARRFLALLEPHGLPADAMVPAWGMSETSSGITFSTFCRDATSDEDSFVEVGRPIRGDSIRIVDDAGTVLQEGAFGRLEVSGSTVMTGYYENLDATREAFTPDGWFRTGDLGFLREGRLTVTGREKDVIIINGINYYSHELESAVEELDGIVPSYSAACAVRGPGDDTDRLAIFFHSAIEEESGLRGVLERVRERVVRQIGFAPDYLLPLPLSDVPKTGIGKIQRTLLSKRFRSGEFRAVLKNVDRLLGNMRTLPDWFFRKVWRRRELLAAADSARGGVTVLFLDDQGIGAGLRSGLAGLGRECIGVEPGSGFAEVAPGRYRLDPSNAADYDRLIQAIEKPGRYIDSAVHLWTCGEPLADPFDGERLGQSQNLGVYSLVFWIQALVRSGGARTPIRILVASRHTQPVLPGDAVAPEKSPLLGVTKSASRELPWIDCRHVDLDGARPETCVQGLLSECVAPSADREVAYRNGRRWVSRLEKVDFRNAPSTSLPFRPGGLYVVSGGLGGIGYEISTRLLRDYGARVLLLGRSPAPGGGAETSLLRTRLETCRTLRRKGGEVHYASVDIRDASAVRAAVREVEARWRCGVDGVIHVAGTYRESPLTEETRESFATTLDPHLMGVWSLARVLADRPDRLFLCISSVAGFFGGADLAAYSAAHAFLDAFTCHLRQRSSIRACYVGWSAWGGIGVSRRLQGHATLRARGYLPVSARQGWQSLLGGLRCGLDRWYVGLDASNRNIRRYATEGGCAVQRAVVCYVAPQGAAQPAWPASVDRFGTPAGLASRKVAAFPRTPAGEIDRAALSTGRADVRGRAERVAPRSDLERHLATLWEEILGVDRVGVHDNFLELGGHSLLATQLVSRIRDLYDVELPLRTLFAEPTIETIALTILQRSAGAVDRDELTRLLAEFEGTS